MVNLSGKFRGENVLLPGILMNATDVLTEFKRVQFPIKFSFGMKISRKAKRRPFAA